MISALKPVLLASLSALCLVACSPRGETISVEQAYENAKSRFVTAEGSADNSLTPEVKIKVSALADSLQKLGSISDAKQLQTESKIIAANLSDLLPISGYQNRPSIDELRKEHLRAAEQDQYSAVDASAKILAMRTYHILSSELEGTKFKIEPLA